MTVNISSIAALLRPGLASVFGDYDQYPSMWSEIFEQNTSDKAVELEVEMKMLGLGQLLNEGAPIAQDSMSQRAVTSFVHRYIGLAFQITRQAIMDNLYKSKFPNMVKSLKKSLAQTKEILGAAIFNNGFDPSYPLADGQPFFSLNHPIDGGSVSNTGTPQQLNESSLESALIQIQQFKDAAGLLAQIKPVKLLLPPQLQYQGTRLLQSAFRTGVANNDISAVYNLSAVPKGYTVNQFLTSPDAWFLLTNADGLKYYSREKIETDVYTDFSTKNLLASAIERYSFGVSNFRAAYGNKGA